METVGNDGLVLAGIEVKWLPSVDRMLVMTVTSVDEIVSCEVDTPGGDEDVADWRMVLLDPAEKDRLLVDRELVAVVGTLTIVELSETDEKVSVDGILDELLSTDVSLGRVLVVRMLLITDGVLLHNEMLEAGDVTPVEVEIVVVEISSIVVAIELLATAEVLGINEVLAMDVSPGEVAVLVMGELVVTAEEATSETTLVLAELVTEGFAVCSEVVMIAVVDSGDPVEEGLENVELLARNVVDGGSSTEELASIDDETIVDETSCSDED